MIDFSPEQLARTWCPKHWGNEVKWRDYPCICDRLTAAIREALKEAEKLGRDDGDYSLAHTHVCEQDDCCRSTGILAYAAAIAALREGRG